MYFVRSHLNERCLKSTKICAVASFWSCRLRCPSRHRRQRIQDNVATGCGSNIERWLVIVYLRSIPAIRNALPRVRTRRDIVTPYAMPTYVPVPRPDVSTPVKRGAYLVQLGACPWCHTLRDENRVSLPGLEFAGGDLITNPFSQASSANLTPDPSGISYYDETQLLKTMHTGKVGAEKIS